MLLSEIVPTKSVAQINIGKKLQVVKLVVQLKLGESHYF